MRHDGDKLTHELPGIEPPVEKRKKAERQKAMGYYGPKERPRCETCKHFTTYYLMPDTLMETERHRCKVGLFRVHRGSICGNYAA